MFEFVVGAVALLAQDGTMSPCARYGSAIAPVQSGSVLCGVSIEGDTVSIHYPDGRMFPVDGEIHMPQQYGANDVTQFWVVEAGANKILGLRDADQQQRVYFISRDESGDRGWFSTPWRCGEYGPNHVYPYSGRGEYTYAAYSMEGHVTFCAIGNWQQNQDQFFVENGTDIFGYDLAALRIRSENCGGEEFEPSNICFTVLNASGDEVFQQGPAAPAETSPSETPDTCARYEDAIAAIAEVNTGDIRCGVSVEDQRVLIHHLDGQIFRVGGDTGVVGADNMFEAAQYFVMDAGASKVLGARNMMGDWIYLLSRVESGEISWYSTPLRGCGQYGTDYVYPYSEDSDYIFAIGNDHGAQGICVLGLRQHTQADFYFEFDELGQFLDANLTPRAWECDNAETSNICLEITDTAGQIVFRSQ